MSFARRETMTLTEFGRMVTCADGPGVLDQLDFHNVDMLEVTVTDDAGRVLYVAAFQEPPRD